MGMVPAMIEPMMAAFGPRIGESGGGACGVVTGGGGEGGGGATTMATTSTRTCTGATVSTVTPRLDERVESGWATREVAAAATAAAALPLPLPLSLPLGVGIVSTAVTLTDADLIRSFIRQSGS